MFSKSSAKVPMNYVSVELKEQYKEMVGGENGEEEVTTMDKKSKTRENCVVNNEAKSFYEKLEKMNEPSGLTLVFDFRETMLDLYLFYKEVTQRGGFSQVTTDRKWDEVASSLDLKKDDSMLLYQLQKVYQNLLYPYEQIQHYRTPLKAKLPDYSQVKQKSHENVLPPLVVNTNELDMPAEKRKRKADSHQQESTRPGTPEEKKSIKKPPKGKESKKLAVPVRPRTSYQFFIKAECDRLKKILGERTNYVNLRTMACDKWKHLTQTEKQPYIEANKADKERYLQELVTFGLQQEKEDDAKSTTSYSQNCDMLKFCTSSETERDYHVKLDPESGNLVPPPIVEPLIIESAADIMKRGNVDSTDPLFNLDEYDCDNLTEISI